MRRRHPWSGGEGNKYPQQQQHESVAQKKQNVIVIEGALFG